MKRIFFAIILIFSVFFLSGCMEKINLQPSPSETAVMCNTMNGTDKEDCLKRVGITLAVKLENETLCNNVHNETERGECETTVIISRAIVRGNPELCDALSDSYIHKYPVCVDNALLARAKMRKDPMICKDITITSIKNACESYDYS